MNTDEKGRPLNLDPEAASADPSLPAFPAKPPGAAAYHGFRQLDVEVDGFRWGMITDFLAEPDTDGDAFVVAPDGSRAGGTIAERHTGLLSRMRRHSSTWTKGRMPRNAPSN